MPGPRSDRNDRGHRDDQRPVHGERPAAFGFHVHGTNTYDYRVTYDDGRYVEGTGIDHFDFNAPGGRSTTFTDTTISRDRGTLYGPDGSRLGTVTIHATFHVTYADANGNFAPDPGEFSAEVLRFRLTCG